MMRELLEKWAALEPEWCRVDDERASVMADVGTALERPRFSAQYHRLGGHEADILAATIEAIEAKGGRWVLRGGPGNWVASVDAEPNTEYWQAQAGSSQSPAEALLTAYLAALEAEGAA